MKGGVGELAIRFAGAGTATDKLPLPLMDSGFGGHPSRFWVPAQLPPAF